MTAENLRFPYYRIKGGYFVGV